MRDELITTPEPNKSHAGDVALAPQAWYEVYALLKSKRPAVADGRLPGVSFRTSRWFGPADMMAELNFPADRVGARTGDLEIRKEAPLQPSTVLDSDSAFDATLAELGFEGWPSTATPRASVLWKRVPGDGTPAWLCAGVMIESPEPVDRPGRFEVLDMALGMGPQETTVHFDVVRRDRAGTRLLFATSTPFKPVRWHSPPLPTQREPVVLLRGVDISVGAPVVNGIPVSKSLTGTLQLPLAPAFAEEAA